jgi:hypothetical protein
LISAFDCHADLLDKGLMLAQHSEQAVRSVDETIWSFAAPET